MYDPSSEPHEFVGEIREEAIQKACKFFDVGEDELSITELESGEVYGAANRVVIVAVPQRGRSGDSRSRPRPAEGREEPAPRRGEAAGRRRRRAPETAVELEEVGPSTGTPMGEIGDLSGFVLGVVERLELGPFELSETLEGGLLAIHVRGPAARSLGSGDGRAADALQLLVNQVAARTSSERQRVVVDVEGDAETREMFLTSLAQRVARRARGSTRAVALDPMNPKDRRIIHIALRDEEDIATMSVGEGRYRQVVVVPEGAPEFEEARRESEAAAARAEP